MTPDAPRPDLDDAEDWFTYWETSGTADDPERAAARVLHAEYDRRRAALDHFRLYNDALVRERDEVRVALEKLTEQANIVVDHHRREHDRIAVALSHEESRRARAEAEVARLRAAVDVHALAEEIHDAIVGAGGDCPDVDDGNDSMCEHVAERIARALAAAPAPAEDEEA